jgi:hypothetical protein
MVPERHGKQILIEFWRTNPEHGVGAETCRGPDVLSANAEKTRVWLILIKFYMTLDSDSYSVI